MTLRAAFLALASLVVFAIHLHGQTDTTDPSLRIAFENSRRKAVERSVLIEDPASRVARIEVAFNIPRDVLTLTARLRAPLPQAAALPSLALRHPESAAETAPIAPTRADPSTLVFTVNLRETGLPRLASDLHATLDFRAPQRDAIFALEGLPRDARITPLWGWVPSLLPSDTAVWSPQLFRLETPYPRSVNYKTAIESQYADPLEYLEHPRYPIVADQEQSLHFKLMRLHPAHEGVLLRRLGFVWNGVKWYQWPDDDHRRPSRVLPLPQYAAVALLFALPLPLLLWAFQRWNGRRARTAIAIALALYALVYLLEFLTSLLPPLLLLVASSLIVKTRLRPATKAYWHLALLVACQQILWTFAFPATRIYLHGFAISLLLAAILLAPILLIRRQWLLLAVAAPLAAALPAYFCALDIYVSYFDDYPTLDVFAYSNQGGYVTDSIASLMQEKHALALMAGLWTLLLLLATALAPTARSDSTLPATP